MRINRGLAIVSMLLGLELALSLSACSPHRSNEGFPPTLDVLNGDNYEDPLWKLVRQKLGISSIAAHSVDDLGAELATLSDLINDPLQAASEFTAQVAAVSNDAEKSVCLEVKSPLVDLNPGAAFGLSNGFSIINGAPKALPLPAKVYMLQYKLMGDTVYRNALVTVPMTAPTSAHMAAPTVAIQSEAGGAYGYPIVMVAHAAASGLAYEEIAQSLGELQSGFITAAPAFPGEPLCKTYDTVSGVKTTTCTGANILAAATGISLPYENDVTDLLGLHDCMKTWLKTPLGAITTAGASAGTEDLSTKIVKVNQSAQTALTSSSPLLSAAAGSPVSIIAGIGRGGAVGGLALARAGAINSVYLSSTDAVAQSALASKGAKPSLFSCAVLLSPQTSFTSGKNKLYLDYWSKESSNILNTAQEAAIDFIPGFGLIHSKISGMRTDPSLSDDAKATAISSYVRSIDLLLHVPLIHAGLENFGKQFRAKLLATSNATGASNTSAASQGAMLVLHGKFDQIADISNSELLTGVGVATTQSVIEGKQAPGIKWLGLGVEPPAANVDANNKLPAGDYGHISSPSFIGGTTSTLAGSMSSNTATDAYLMKSPAEVTAKWIGSACVDSINANAAP
ncbi:MAG: hypothetical protein H7249_17475 [Chitinophagaceae bacterium]|nr:hypothetical protein [Oligoflexus sp.]